MSIDFSKFRILQIDDLNSKISLTRWLRANSIEDDDSIVSDDRINIYLNFIENQVLDQRIKDKREWLDAIDRVRARVSSGRFS